MNGMKKISVLFFVLLFVFSGCLSTSETSNTAISENKSSQLVKKKKYDVQVVLQETVNLSSSETSWLPLQIQDKLKSNLQTYLGMKTVVDSKSESALKKLQAAAKKYPGKLFCRQNRRFEPAFNHVREIIDSGILGDVYEIKLCRHSFGFLQFR